MSDLSEFGAHARAMSTAEHKPECQRWLPKHMNPTRPDPSCPGCVSGNDRALSTRLADEVDAYLSHDEAEGLFA